MATKNKTTVETDKPAKTVKAVKARTEPEKTHLSKMRRKPLNF